MTNSASTVETEYQLAREQYAALGVDTEAALERLRTVAISLHCWQGDDVGGFEAPGGPLGGGIAATGSYPGKARTGDELRSDLHQAFKLAPGKHRLNLHAIYAETGGDTVPRDRLAPEHFAAWVEWARDSGLHGLDFNPTLFSHPLADDGFTLSSADPAKRRFWIDHCIACRHIGEHFGRELGTPCVTNIWIPDGYKDMPADRKAPRERLRDSLDEILAVPVDRHFNYDAVESKLFGLGSESYVVGSHEFYLGYAITREVLLCLDSGHFHPTEVVSDKLSAVLLYIDRVLLHVSRGVRWDSDHVITLNDELQAVMQELVRGNYLDRVHIGLDFFDASINRVGAWVIGLRNALRALLLALLEPRHLLLEAEANGDYTTRLALLEEAKGLPFGAVWDAYCQREDVPVGRAYLDELRSYEKAVLATRT